LYRLVALFRRLNIQIKHDRAIMLNSEFASMEESVLRADEADDKEEDNEEEDLDDEEDDGDEEEDEEGEGDEEEEEVSTW